MVIFPHRLNAADRLYLYSAKLQPLRANAESNGPQISAACSRSLDSTRTFCATGRTNMPYSRRFYSTSTGFCTRRMEPDIYSLYTPFTS
jgi:hypothetical protein